METAARLRYKIRLHRHALTGPIPSPEVASYVPYSEFVADLFHDGNWQTRLAAARPPSRQSLRTIYALVGDGLPTRQPKHLSPSGGQFNLGAVESH